MNGLDLFYMLIVPSASFALGFAVAGYRRAAAERRVERRAWRECQQLHESRALVDMRDQTSARFVR